MIRRTFLVVAFALAGISRRAWTQTADAAPRYFPLSRPVRIPLADVSQPWRLVSFTAEAMAPTRGNAAGRRVLMSGVLFRRTPPADRVESSLSALCLTCPHEQCRVDLITDPSQLVTISGKPDNDPVFECGCHSSVFDARNDGARIAGETPRGLFRFRITSVSDDAVEIGEIEEEALLVV